MDARTQPAGTAGPLGPAVAGAIEDYNAAVARLGTAEAALETAQREVAGARARLSALAAGARVTGARGLVAVGDVTDEDASDEDADADR